MPVPHFAKGLVGGGQAPFISFDVESLSKEVKRLEERGAVFLHRSLKFEWGTIADFNDPYGNRLELGEIIAPAVRLYQNKCIKII